MSLSPNLNPQSSTNHPKTWHLPRSLESAMTRPVSYNDDYRFKPIRSMSHNPITKRESYIRPRRPVTRSNPKFIRPKVSTMFRWWPNNVNTNDVIMAVSHQYQCIPLITFLPIQQLQISDNYIKHAYIVKDANINNKQIIFYGDTDDDPLYDAIYLKNRLSLANSRMIDSYWSMLLHSQYLCKVHLFDIPSMIIYFLFETLIEYKDRNIYDPVEHRFALANKVLCIYDVTLAVIVLEIIAMYTREPQWDKVNHEPCKSEGFSYLRSNLVVQSYFNDS